MATAEVVHRSLDGRRFQLSGPLDLDLPFTSVVDVAIGGRLHELTAGPTGLGPEVARALGAGGFDEELSYADGTLLVGQTRPYDRQTGLLEELLVAVWQGDGYCLVTQLYGGTTAGLLGMLRALRIEEHDDGLTIRPAAAGAGRGGGASGSAGVTFAAPATVVKQVPTVGLLELSPLTDQHIKTMPAWRGMSTAAGEVFRDSLSDGKPYFVLASTDTWTTVVPLADVSPEQVPDRLGRLRVKLVG